MPGGRLIGSDCLICAARRAVPGAYVKPIESSDLRLNLRHTNADPMGSPVTEPRMMSSQLGRIILGGSASTPDEMNAQPDQDGRYGPIDELLEEITAEPPSGSEGGDDRRSGPQSTAGTNIG